MKYMFDVPDGWDIKDCFIKIENNGNVEIEKPVDHMIFERAKTTLEPVLDDSLAENTPEWMDEFQFDPDASERICRIIYHYPICLKDVAKILESLAPLLETMPGYSVADEVARFVCKKLMFLEE